VHAFFLTPLNKLIIHDENYRRNVDRWYVGPWRIKGKELIGGVYPNRVKAIVIFESIDGIGRDYKILMDFELGFLLQVMIILWIMQITPSEIYNGRSL
jgi:hypothetical protein